MSLAKLEFIAAFTLALLFGIVAGIIALIIWMSGYSGVYGLPLVFGLSIALVVAQWWFSPKFIRVFMGLKEASKTENPGLYGIIGELSKKAGIKMPRVYISSDPTPNAFAFGRSKGDANIAVHAGLLKMLDKNEVEGVLAHEIGHIKHRDMIVMTIASVIPLILYYIAILFVPRGREEKSSLTLVFFGAMAARMLGMFIVLWLSRTREYYADEFSARLTKQPKYLASALAKITGNFSKSKRSEAVKAFYIAYPESSFMEIFMTHPGTRKRIVRLEKISKELSGKEF